MKKILLTLICVAMMLSGCHRADEGAMNGAMFGSMIGGAIGGITGGWRGHDVGTLVGMAGGAAAGAAIGSANERAEKKQVRERYRKMNAKRQKKYEEEMRKRGYQTNDDVYGVQGSGTIRVDEGVYLQPVKEQPRKIETQKTDDSGFDPTNSGDDRLYDFK